MREPFSVYVHLPYCAKRCPYCDFNTYVVHSIPEERYVAALVREAAFAASTETWSGRRVSTVFFGGGTPSLFSPPSVARILQTFDRLWGMAPDPEITLEANPGSLEGGGEEKLRGFRAAGLTRLSFGAQSFNAKHLATLGRIHSAKETRGAFEAARRAGFDNVSCDLIYGVPGQTLAEWEADLDTAIDLGTEHVSAYCLTYEDGTPMTGMKKAGLVTAADDETELAMFRRARELFAAAGLRHYEVSNYARPGRESRHNLAYWTWRDYLGLGAGAHGFAAAERKAAAPPDAGSDVAAGNAAAAWGRRYANIRLPELYMSASEGKWHASEEALSREMAMAEYLMVGLRLADGVDSHEFDRLFGTPLGQAAPRLEEFLAGGLLHRDGPVVTLSERGLQIADTVIARLAAG
ncbi:MAG: radical SAM family heme chaperone HemW [Candidatus Binatia bacterium]